MKASIIKIGNSKGIRIPKVMLEETQLGPEVELTLRGNDIVITRLKAKRQPRVSPELLLSEEVLSDWLRPEEDEAWKDLQ